MSIDNFPPLTRDEHNCLWIGESVEGTLVANCENSRAATNGTRVPTSELRAEWARLFAAAPETAAELDKAIDIIQRFIDDTAEHYALESWHEELFADARQFLKDNRC